MGVTGPSVSRTDPPFAENVQMGTSETLSHTSPVFSGNQSAPRYMVIVYETSTRATETSEVPQKYIHQGKHRALF